MTIRIGNGCGFWGDNLDAPVELAAHGRLDVLTLEYLAELTMSILALQQQRDPSAGYAGDFLDVLYDKSPSGQPLVCASRSVRRWTRFSAAQAASSSSVLRSGQAGLQRWTRAQWSRSGFALALPLPLRHRPVVCDYAQLDRSNLVVHDVVLCC